MKWGEAKSQDKENGYFEENTISTSFELKQNQRKKREK